ncbi:MAG: SDR family NAD(P)-dependent oxidoreductase [Desulfobacteria bacterium]
MRLKGRSAIITGAGQGIGRAIAVKLAQEGAWVVVTDLDQDSAKNVENEIKGMGCEALSYRVDVTKYDQVEGMVKDVARLFNGVDILVNNAGWDKIEPFLQSEEATWDKVISINFKGPINCFKAVLPLMIERNSGKVISISSDAGRVGSTGEAVYSGTKAGIIGFSKTIAREVARHNIHINCVCPGPTDTPLLQSIASKNPKLVDALKKVTPLGKLAKPEDIAGAVAFLASDEAGHITGQVLSVSGGMTMV